MSLGPALLLGSVAGVVVILKNRVARPVELTVLAFLPVFLAASFVLRGFFQAENWPYEYLVFPATVLLCVFLTALPAGRVRAVFGTAFLGLAVVGLFYVFLRFSNPLLSAETRFIADLAAREARPQEVVVTNLVDQQPPLQPWNVGGLYVARQKADRLLRSEISSQDQLRKLLDQFQVDTLDIVFLRTSVQPLDPWLEQALSALPVRTLTLPAHEGALPFSLQLRDFYWKLSGRHQTKNTASAAAADRNLTLTHFRLSRTSAGDLSVTPLPLKSERD